jgi:hypothetical protein
MPRDRITGEQIPKSVRGTYLWPLEEGVGDPFEPKYFPPKDLNMIRTAMRKIEGVGITIIPYREEPEEQRASFFGLAKLWRTVKVIIGLVFIEKMKEGRLLLEDQQGNSWGLRLVTRTREAQWEEPTNIPQPIEEPTDDDFD